VAKADGKTAKTPGGEAQAKRAAGREKKIRAGIDDLETWLCDLLRQGLATAQGQPHSYWETSAARLVDAQAPGLARLVRDMTGICASGDGWQGRLLDQIARLNLAMEGYRRIDLLPEGTQADLRSVVGITQKQEEVLTGTPVADNWLILGREIEEEFKLKTQRVWLWGQNSRRPALILSFAAPGSTLDTSLIPGVAIPGELVFYPGAYPLRAVISSRQPAVSLPQEIPGCASLVDATAEYAAALAANPWIERFPMVLTGVIPHLEENQWQLYDASQRCLPLARNFMHGWTLLAISGGRPIGVFGEWNGECLLPLSAFAEGEFHAFKPRLE
jgi:hypothetical protein